MNRYSSIVIAIFSILLAGCPGSKSSTDVVQLKLNLEKGKSYVYNTSTHFDMNMNKMATGVDLAYTFKLSLDSKDSAGNQILDSKIDALKFKADVMGMSMGYDSKEVIDTNHQDAFSGMFRKMFSGMLGKNFKITIGPTGTIENVTGVEEMVSGMLDGIPGGEEEKAKMKQQLNQSFNQDQVKQTFAQAFNFYPDKPVKIGDSWNKDVDFGVSGIKSTSQITYKVKDITSSSVILDMKGETKTLTKSAQDTTGMAPSTNFSGSSTGSMTVDRTTGLITAGDIDLTMKGSIDMKGNKMPMDMKGKITFGNK